MMVCGIPYLYIIDFQKKSVTVWSIIIVKDFASTHILK